MQYFGVPRCPYCKKRVNIIRTWSLKKQGEYICPRCNGISNIYLSPLIYIFAVIALFSAAALYFFHKFILDDIVPRIGIQVIVPFILFFILSLFTVYLEKPVIKKSKVSKKEMRGNGPTEDRRRKKTETTYQNKQKNDVRPTLKVDPARPKFSPTSESKLGAKGVRSLSIEGRGTAHLQTEDKKQTPRAGTQLSTLKQSSAPAQKIAQEQRTVLPPRNNKAINNPAKSIEMPLKASQVPVRKRETLFDDETEKHNMRSSEAQENSVSQKRAGAPVREQKRAEAAPARRVRDRSDLPVRKDDTEAFLVKEVMSKYDNPEYINQRIKEIETGENKTYRNIR